jgi:hypothetical protein
MLSKSDFKIASTCAKKLVYKKASYITTNDENEYLEMLAQGGHIVAKYAQLTYPNGIEIKAKNIDHAVLETTRLIKDNISITLFEATILSEEKVVRMDILEKKNNVLNLIEVKSKSWDSDDDDENPQKRLREYIEDLAFQTFVLREAYPEYEIHSFLLLPDKSKRTTIDGLAGWFSVNQMVDEKFEIEELPAQNKSHFVKPLVEFKYENDPERERYISQLRSDSLLTLINFDKQVQEMMDSILERSSIFLGILKNGIKSDQYSINKICKKCEFNLGIEKLRNGYRECWQDLTDVAPNIFDLYYGGSIGNAKSGWYLDELISQKKVSLFDIDPERLINSSGELGARGQRQLTQINFTKTNQEWTSDGLSDELKNLKYPLHFIDFETYLGAIPHHRGMRPYELIAFQWSCHTIKTPSSEPIHSEWLNLDYSFPNFRFAESLMNQIGETGTPLMWTSFENSILRNILEQMEIHDYSNDSLKDWLTRITTDKKQNRDGRFVDMNDLTIRHYFHPQMKGRTSIKKVLPAIWNNNPYLHSIPWFRKYSKESDIILNPYDTLAPIIGELENEEVVKDGTGAMSAYHEIMFGSSVEDNERRKQLRKLLLQYCELDTMAMVIIWKYWIDRLNL